jgi:ribonuclease T2
MPGLTALRLGLCALLILWSSGAGTAAEQRAHEFDYYLLALSWSPTYCASRARRDPLQCGQGRRYHFVVHGLWPQYRNGWPQYCAAAGVSLPRPLLAAMFDIMPSFRLIQHQWMKHGTCTGLAPGDYFALTRRLYDAIEIPARYRDPRKSIEVSVDQIVADFVAANRNLAPDMISVKCGNRRDRAQLVELGICFSPQGALRSCGANEKRQCRADRLVLPRLR